MKIATFLAATGTGAWLLAAAGAASAAPAHDDTVRLNARTAGVIAYWTVEKRSQAIPRDLVLDRRGQGYLRHSDGTLEPWGRSISGNAPVTRAGPPSGGGGGGSDTTPPSISNLDPSSGAALGSAYTFSATVTDASGIKSVTFYRQKSGGTIESFAASTSGGNVWSRTFTDLTTGNWTWWVAATDNARRGGNTATSPSVAFSVDAGTSTPGGDTVTDGQWTARGAVQTAAGRLYFEMPANAKRKGLWSGYVCSGTVVTDGVSGRSIILTAAHCVYDDTNKAFARNVLFIPDQAETTGAGTDLNCSNDPLGCWSPSFGVVDRNWTTRTFPDNIPWDYAIYVVSDSGAHSGTSANSALDVAAGHLDVSFAAPAVDDGVVGAASPDFTYALGYSYSQDPELRYCAEDMTTEGAANWWLPSCAMTGGSSGGPWLQPMTSPGNGPVISVNSWGYTNSPGMAGPRLSGTSAMCVYDMAIATAFNAVPTTDGDAGEAVDCVAGP